MLKFTRACPRRLGFIPVFCATTIALCSAYTVPEDCTRWASLWVLVNPGCSSVNAIVATVGDNLDDEITLSINGGTPVTVPYVDDDGNWPCAEILWNGNYSSLVQGMNTFTAESWQLGFLWECDITRDQGSDGNWHTWGYNAVSTTDQRPDGNLCMLSLDIVFACVPVVNTSTRYIAYETPSYHEDACIGPVYLTTKEEPAILTIGSDGKTVWGDDLKADCPPYDPHTVPCMSTVTKYWHVYDRWYGQDLDSNEDDVTQQRSPINPMLMISDSRVMSGYTGLAWFWGPY